MAIVVLKHQSILLAHHDVNEHCDGGIVKNFRQPGDRAAEMRAPGSARASRAGCGASPQRTLIAQVSSFET